MQNWNILQYAIIAFLGSWFVLKITEDKTLGAYLKFPVQLLKVLPERGEK